MPLYEYWCPQCKAQFEKLRPMGRKDAEVKCSMCGSSGKRMLSVVAAVGRGGEDCYPARGGCACGGGGCACGGH